jgi:hypothetical protein
MSDEIKSPLFDQIKMDASYELNDIAKWNISSFRGEYGALRVVSTSFKGVSVDCVTVLGNRTGCELTGSVPWVLQYKLTVKLKMNQSFYPYQRDIHRENEVKKWQNV